MATNMKMERKGDKLFVEIDLSKTFGPSSSGKSITIASSEGNIAVEGSPEIKIGLNVYTKAATAPKAKGKK